MLTDFPVFVYLNTDGEDSPNRKKCNHGGNKNIFKSQISKRARKEQLTGIKGIVVTVSEIGEEKVSILECKNVSDGAAIF